MTIARVVAAAGLMLGITMMVTVAMAQPAPAPSQPGATPGSAAPATQPGTPATTPAAPGSTAPGAEPPPPAIGPDGLPIAPPADATTAPATPAPAVEEPKPPEITLISLVLTASVVVQVIMAMLVLWSIATWSIMFSKLSYFSGLNNRTNRFLQAFRGAGSLQDAAKTAARNFKENPLAKMVSAAVDEIGAGKKSNVSSRVSQRMAIVQSEVGEELSTGMGIFATVGSIAVFVGLFGTVYGIMRSFIGIAQTQTTNLAVVAPGIAEALLATAIGLFAAIPAVIFYNMFARRIGAFQSRMDNFANEVLVRVARDFEG